MPHSVCMEEIAEVARWLQQRLAIFALTKQPEAGRSS
jgi:hypothetical protein